MTKEYNEDDTFNRLRRIPFKKMKTLFEEESNRIRGTCDSSQFINYQIKFLKSHNWTMSGYLMEMRKNV